MEQIAEAASSMASPMSGPVEGIGDTDRAARFAGSRKRAYIATSVVLTIMALFDSGTDWANTAIFYIDYRTVSNATVLAYKAQFLCRPDNKSANMTERDMQSILTIAEGRTLQLSTLLFVFTALGFLNMILRLYIRWAPRSQPEDNNVAVNEYQAGERAENSKQENIKKLTKPSPFMNNDSRVVFSEVMTLLIEDSPLTWINVNILVNTCQQDHGLNPALLATSLGSMVSSLMVVWNFALHFAYSITGIFSCSCFDRFREAVAKDTWSFSKKCCLYPWIVLITTITLFVLFNLFLTVGYLLCACACFECLCTNHDNKRQEKELSCSKCLCSFLKTLFVERPGETLRVLVMYIANVVFLTNLLIVLHYFNSIDLKIDPLRGFHAD